MLACWDAAIAARSTMLPGRSGTMTLIFASRPSLASPRRRMVETRGPEAVEALLRTMAAKGYQAQPFKFE